ncbi:hypothetical protein GCM10028777_23010 [Angustibacter speluncae]
MSRRFEELAFAETPMGELTLRRRVEPVLGVEVHEVRLGEEYLMSSLFTEGEEELARLGLAALDASGSVDVVVGGLGLGFTARAALADERVAAMLVVDALPDVIDWHVRGLLPGSEQLTADPRVRLVEGDFFAMSAGEGYDPDAPGRRFDAVLLDVDHTPDHRLNPSHGGFYTVDGLTRMARFLRPGGVFALWSDEAPDPAFTAVMEQVLDDVRGHVVDFPNPLTGGRSVNGVYVGLARA